MSRTWLAQHLGRGEDATPVGIDVAVGATALIVAMFVASAIPRAQPEWRDALVALALGVFAAATVDVPAVAALVPGSWMVMDGFLVNRLGNLSWQGSSDAYRLLSLIVAGGAGLALGGMYRRWQQLRQRWQWDVQVQAFRDQIIEEQPSGETLFGDQVIEDRAARNSVPTESARETTHHA